jgi:hypothetical protein
MALLCAIVLSFTPVQTTFDVSAVSDRLTYTTTSANGLNWSVSNADVDIGLPAVHERIDKGLFQPGSDVLIQFLRLGREDLNITCETSGTSIGTLSINGIDRVLPDRVVFHVHLKPAPASTIFPISGVITVGGALTLLPEFSSRAILRSGNVKPIGT